MQLEKEKTRTGNGNTSPAERLAELAKNNFESNSFILDLSFANPSCLGRRTDDTCQSFVQREYGKNFI